MNTELNKQIESNNNLNTEKNIFKRVWKYFTAYERIWMLVIFLISLTMSILLPEDDANGVSGVVITILYFFDVIIGCLCELLFSKQNRWAFLIYNLVEVIEIITMIILRVRFASLAVCIFFWIPAHTLGFFQWNKFIDKKDKTKTVVRKLKTWQTVLIFVVTIVWTLGFGYLLARFSPETDFLTSDLQVKILCYMDACLSIMSIIDGILMFFRSKESWWTWYLYIIVETAFNIISGQWVLLVYKFGYLTNTTYGIVKWSKYMKEHENEE